MRLVPVFMLETHNQTNHEFLTKFVQTNNASSSTKTAINFFSVECWVSPTRFTCIKIDGDEQGCLRIVLDQPLQRIECFIGFPEQVQDFPRLTCFVALR